MFGLRIRKQRRLALPGTPVLNTAQLAKLRESRMRVQQKGDLVRAQLVLPDGRKFQALLKATPEALAGDDELAGFMSKLKKGFKKIAKVPGIKQIVKAHTVPLKLVHKVTHHKNSPIRKLEMAVQKQVGKALPFTKPFIKVHNSLAKPVHKAIAGKKIRTALTAKAIADVTKNLPSVQKAATRQALVIRAKQADVVREVATGAAKAKVLKAAAKALKKNPANKAAKRMLVRGKPQRGFYTVRHPDGRVSKVPASKVA